VSRSRVLPFVALALFVGHAPLPSRAHAQRLVDGDPKLLVIVVVDQMRFDYLDRYRGLFTHGLRRLASEGALFERAFYPYLNTVTCAGHATIGTGTLPSTHGIIMNEWWQRAANRRMSCTDDPTVRSVPYVGAPERIGHSAHRLRVPTLADRLRDASPQARVVTLSMKPRSSVMLAGHGGTAVTWFGDSNSWATSTAFAPAPIPEIAAYVAQHPVDRDRAQIWDRGGEAGKYVGSDTSPYERPQSGWTSPFPHPLAGAPGAAEARFFELWERSPYSDAYLGAMAADLVHTFKLGQRDATDFLGVSFSSVDYVGHDFGPDSQEVQDALLRLDRTLGDFLAMLDVTVGRDRYVLGLSADHGVSPIPESIVASGGDAGRVTNAQVRRAAEDAMAAAFGPGPHVAHVEYTNLYLTDAARARASADPKTLQPVLDALAKVNGVLRVFPSQGLERKRESADPIERAAALSYFPGESGDVTIVLKPNWIGTDSSAATHGSHHPYDRHVPVIFLGKAFKPGRYSTPASPADLAPTLAATIKLPMPGIDGRSLLNVAR
jgi:arylsulfatase A-like enzyme